MSVSLLWLDDSHQTLGCSFLQKNSLKDCVPVWTISRDQGETWTLPTRIIKEKGYNVLNNDRVILTSKNRLLVPVAWRPKRRVSHYITRIYYSDDLAKIGHYRKQTWMWKV